MRVLEDQLSDSDKQKLQLLGVKLDQKVENPALKERSKELLKSLNELTKIS